MSDSPRAPGRSFVLRYYDRRREVLTAIPHDADPTRLYEQLAAAALPDVAHCLVVADADGRVVFARCVLAHEHGAESCLATVAADLDLAHEVKESLMKDLTSTRVAQGAASRVLVAPLVVEEQAAGAVVFARRTEEPDWSAQDHGTIHDVVTALGVDLERLRLRFESRQALRASQRVASQLHQLISASLVVGTLTDESDIALNLVRSARSLFDGDRAAVVVHHASESVVATVQRGRIPRLIDATLADATRVPSARPEASDPWVHDGWLCAPVLDGHDRARGLVATHRDGEASFTAEDYELAMLLARLAATSLDALDLNRTISDNETRLRILVDAAPVSIVESDDNGRVRWWNQSASRLLRWPDYAVDVVDAVRWPADVEAALVGLWNDLLAGGLRDNEELRAEVGGRERLLALSAAVVPTGTQRPNILTLLDDVTDQRELREEVRHAHRMELRGQVASSVAHDFNNLITLILGYAELLSRNVAGDEKSEELVRDIQATSSRASTLTAQLQSIGRTSAPAPVSLDVGAALGANAEVLERIMGSVNTVVWELAESTPPVKVDADLFEQMILNLSINARDAMPEGGTLTFTSGLRELDEEQAGELGLRAGPFVTLRIADTGTGMDEATRQRCFEPLFTTKGPFKGTGLGLASARRLVLDSGGVITCSSTLGEGTAFTIWLPAQVESDRSAPATDVPVVSERPRIPATILLCEDDAALRRLARQVLARHGFEVLECVSAEDALETRERFGARIDMLVTDVVLPEMDGPELARRLQGEQPDLVVVVMSGTASPDAVAGLRQNSASFLAKPFKPSALVDEVIGLLSRRTVVEPQEAAGSKR